MQNAGTALPVRPAGHLGGGSWAAAVVLAGATGAALAEGATAATLALGIAADAMVAAPFASSLLHAARPPERATAAAARNARETRVGPDGTGVIRMAASIRAIG